MINRVQSPSLEVGKCHMKLYPNSWMSTNDNDYIMDF